MRGLVERRCLAIAVTRARGPSCTRKLSGIGRGQGDGREAGSGRRLGNQFSHEDADEPLFPVGGGGYGHGAPLNSNFAGSSRSGIGADLGDEAAHQSIARQFGDGSSGRGSAGYRPGDMGGTIQGGTGPLLPNISLGRGSSLQRPTSEDSLFSERRPGLPTFSLGLGGFGRGKTVQTKKQSEDSFSEGHRKVLPKWDETIRKIEEKDNALRAEELKLFDDARPAPVLGYPGSPAAPLASTSRPRLVQGQGDDFSSRNTQSTGPAFGFSQQSRALDPGRFVLQEEHSKVDKGNNLAQALRSSTLPGWQPNAVSEGVVSGQGRRPSPPQSHHNAVHEASTSTYQHAPPPHLHFSEGEALHHVSSGQSSRPRFTTADAVRQAPETFPGSASSMSKLYDNTTGESHYRAGSQPVPTFPGLATALTKPYDSTNARRQVPPEFPGLATARGEPYDITKGESHYRAGSQAVPTFPGLATASTKPYDSTNAGMQLPPAFPGLATARGESYDNTKAASETSPGGLTTSTPKPYDHTTGKYSYSAGKQAAPTFLEPPSAMPKPHDTTKREYDVGRQVPPAFPGSATVTGEPYDKTKGESYRSAPRQSPPAFPGSATASWEPSDIAKGESYYSGIRQASPVFSPSFPGMATASWQPYDNTKGEYDVGMQIPPAFPRLATATGEPCDNTKGDFYHSVPRQSPPAFPGSATALREPYDNTKGEYDAGRQVPPPFPRLVTATGEPYDKTMGDSYHSFPRQSPPAFPGSATASWEPYDVTKGESQYSGIRQASPMFSSSFPGTETSLWGLYDNTKGEYDVGRQVPPAIPGLATATGEPYDYTKGESHHRQSPPAFPGSATALREPYDNTTGEYDVGRQVPLAFPGLATATGEPYDTTKGESYHSVPRQFPPAFPGLATALREPYSNTKGEYDVGRQAPPAFPRLATPTGEPYDNTKGPRQSPLAFPGLATASWEPHDRQGESYYSGARQASPVFSPSGMSEFYDNVARQVRSEPSRSDMRESYLGTYWHAAPSAPATSETEGSINMASRQAAPPAFSASRSEQFQYDASGQPIESAFSGMRLAQDVSAMPYNDESYYHEGWQPAWPTVATADSSQQTPTDFQQTERWYSDMSTSAPQESWPTSDSTHYFSQQTQGQDGHDSEGCQPSWSASASSEYSGGNMTSEANDYNYDWIGQSPESTELHRDASHQVLAEKTLHPEVGSAYDERIEECYTQGRLEVIGTIYDEMKASQVQASPKTYDTLMQTFMKLGKTEKMSQVYQEMREVIMPSYVKTHKPKVEDDTMRTAVKDDEKPATLAFAQGTGQSGYGASEEMPCSEVELQTKINTEQQPRQAYDQGGGSVMSTDQSMPPDESLPGFLPFGMQKSSPGAGAGRGKKVPAFFDFAGPEGAGLGRGQPQPEQETKSGKIDDYSETFQPVIRPELQYAFAPEGLSGGPGAGRGRPLAPQSPGTSIGRGSPFLPQTYDSGVGRGRLPFPQAHDAGVRTRTPYPQYVEAAVQPQQPFYTDDMQGEFQQGYPREQFQPALSREEAGHRAMQILDERLHRKLKRMEEWQSHDDEDSVSVRRKPVRMPQARAPKEKSQLIKISEQEDKAQLTEEQVKEETARVKAMEKNEQVEELQHTLSQFMKNYGEMGLELEYLMGDFLSNPDIEEKPLPPLEEYLEKAKPNIMKTGIIRSEGEWQRMVNDVLRNASYFEEFVEQYSGPGRYTAKQENEDLEAIAKTLPLDAAPKFQSSIQRTLTTLKSNPGFNLDEKQWMLSNMVDEFFELSQYEDHNEAASSQAMS